MQKHYKASERRYSIDFHSEKVYSGYNLQIWMCKWMLKKY